MRITLRALSAFVITGSLVVGTIATSAAQEPGEQPTGFAELCEVDVGAPCLDIVATCLEPAGDTAGVSEPTRAADLLRCATDTLGEGARYVVRGDDLRARWIARDDDGDRLKVGSRKWRAVASSTAGDLAAYLLTVTPGPCIEGMLLDAWTLYGAFRLAADGAKSGERLVDDALTDLVWWMRVDVPPECGTG